MAVLLNGTNGLIQAYDYQTPTTGFSYTFAAGTQTLVMNPAGTLATGTITMPASPSDGMTITISTTQQITALTLSGNTGQTVNNATTFIAAASATAYVYRASSATWFPFDSIPQLLNVPLGVGQTWQNVTGSRALGTTYTNSTGRPITVVIRVLSTTTYSNSSLTVAGVAVPGSYTSITGGSTEISAVVPAGATYVQVNTYSSTLDTWCELR